jgi:2',3'-cyclic-nucleotide 2'-phosphodiesterase / 3'-nucleotidase
MHKITNMSKLFIQKLLIGVAYIIVLLPVCIRANDVKVKIISVTDLHATILLWDYTNDRPANGSLTHVKTYVDQERARDDQHVILLDNGDLLQGQPAGYYYNFVVPEKPHLIVRAMNMLGFDAASVGNHDIETGPEVYSRVNNEFNFPWLSANIVNAETDEPWFKPYTIIERDGIRIAIIALVTPSVPNWLPRKLWDGMEFQSMYSAAAYWMDYIQSTESPDAVVGLFHSGSGPDIGYDGDNTYLENASLYVARYVPGFDVVFTGHDHQERNQKITNIYGEEVLMVAGAPYGRSVGVVDLIFKRNGEANNMKSKESYVVNTSDLDPCEAMTSYFHEEMNEVREFVNQPLGYLEKELNARKSYWGNADFVDLIHHIQREITRADVSFAAPLSFDAIINDGVLSMKDMFRLYQYENYLYVMELTGHEIKEAMEHSYGMWFNTMENSLDNLLLFRKDSNGDILISDNERARLQYPFFNFESASGIHYTVDVRKNPGERVKIGKMGDGSVFDPGKTYRVAINSYRGSGGGGHLTVGAGIRHEDLESRIVFVSDRDLRSYIADYIRTQGRLKPVAGSNWKVIPEEWVKQAIPKDYRMLFGEEYE